MRQAFGGLLVGTERYLGHSSGTERTPQRRSGGPRAGDIFLWGAIGPGFRFYERSTPDSYGYGRPPGSGADESAPPLHLHETARGIELRMEGGFDWVLARWLRTGFFLSYGMGCYVAHRDVEGHDMGSTCGHAPRPFVGLSGGLRMSLHL